MDSAVASAGSSTKAGREDAARQRRRDGHEAQLDAGRARGRQRLEDLRRVLVLQLLVRFQVHGAHRVVRPGRRRDAAARRAGHADDVHARARQLAGARQRQQAELDRRREAAGRRHRARRADRLAVQLGQAVDEAAQQLGVGVLGAVVALVRGRVAQPKVARHVDHLHTRRDDRGRVVRRHLVGQRQQRDVGAARRLVGRDVLEAQRAAARQRRVHGPERLAHVVDRDDADQLDVGMDEQAPDQLGAAVPRAADDDGLEALHRLNCNRRRGRARPRLEARRRRLRAGTSELRLQTCVSRC